MRCLLCAQLQQGLDEAHAAARSRSCRTGPSASICRGVRAPSTDVPPSPAPPFAPQLQRSLASEREAREAAYQERSLIQIELEAKQRRFEHALDAARAQAEQASAELASAEQARAEAEARCREATEALQAERRRLAELQVCCCVGLYRRCVANRTESASVYGAGGSAGAPHVPQLTAALHPRCCARMPRIWLLAAAHKTCLLFSRQTKVEEEARLRRDAEAALSLYPATHPVFRLILLRNRPRSMRRRGCAGMPRRRTSVPSSSWRPSPTAWRRCRWALRPGLLFGLAVQLLLLLQCC